MKYFLHFFGSLKIKLPLVPTPPFSSVKIGLMGGSFNPLHEGHVKAANEAMRRLKLDQVWFLVTPGNPLKSRDELAPLTERFKKVQNSIRDRRMKVVSIEEELGTCFTSGVLCYLKGRHSRIKFVWIMGADNLVNFHFWNNWRFIADHFPFLIVDRPHWRFKALSSPAAQRLAKFRIKEERCNTLLKQRTPAWVLLSNKLVSQSSTILRRKV